MPIRYDRTEQKLDARRTPQGFLRCDATIARTGVQVYRLPDGSTRREYRPPDEVFKADALASFRDAPVTLGHPSAPVSAENAKAVGVGFVTDTPEASDGRFVRTKSLLITDAAAINEAESGRAAQVSCGYECDLEMTPGTAPDGEKYDAIQRNIRGNHVALVPVGRAGPEVRLRLDSNDNAVIDAASTPRGESMEKIVINGVTYEVTPQVAQALQAKFKADAEAEKARKDAADAAATKAKSDADAAAKALASAQAEAEKQKARADAAEEAKAKAEKARADAEDPKRIAEAVKSRVTLEKQVSVLAPKVKTDGLTDKEVKLAALKELDIKTEGKSDAYCDARFDAALEEAAKKNPADKALAGFLGSPKADEDKDRQDAEDPREKFMREQTAPKGDKK